MKYSSKKASGYYEYREKNRTKLRDLIYFLGEDWIDISAIVNEKTLRYGEILEQVLINLKNAIYVKNTGI